MEQTGFPRSGQCTKTVCNDQSLPGIGFDLSGRGRRKERGKLADLVEQDKSMGLKRQSSFSARLVRMLVVPSMFLVIAVCVWSVLIIAPLSLPCGESCYTLLDMLAINPALQVDPAAVHIAGNSLAIDLETGSVEQPLNSWPVGNLQGMHHAFDLVGDVNLLTSSAFEDPEKEKASYLSGSMGLLRSQTYRSARAPEGRQNGEQGSNRTPNEESAVRDSKLQARSNGMPSEEEVLAGVMADMEKLRISRAPLTVKQNSTGSESCDGRYVYVYDLPSKFNADLVANCSTIMPWHSLCEFFSNSGMGKVRYDQALVPSGRWFETLQYSLEVLFHAKLLHYRCLTSDPASASLFYIPFYAGLDVLHWNFASNTTTQQRDQLSHDLVQWLETQTWWHRKGGRDHVLVLGKITWDFRRVDNRTTSWGSCMLNLPQMQNLTKLLIERDPWHVNDIGVPHPTYFHPSSDDDIRLWQQLALNSPRDSFVSFAGMPRPGDPNNIRTRLIQQCEEKRNASLCRVLKCHKHLCLKPEATMKLFLNSHFCMQPGGDSPTRRSIFDSLIAGCIPVLFDPYSAYAQYPWHLPKDSDSYSVYIPQEHVRKGIVDVVSILQQVPEAKLEQMRKTILLEIMPHLLYAEPGAKLSVFNDAFDVSLQNMMHRAYTRSSNM